MSEIVPYEIQLNQETFWVVGDAKAREEYLRDHLDIAPKDLGILAVGIFRTKTYTDYAAIGRVDDVEEEISWIRAYELYEWVDWMAGMVYCQPERAQELSDTERRLGRFVLQFGWAPDVVLETEPNENEIEGYINHIIRKDELDGQLVFPREEEDDGN